MFLSTFQQRNAKKLPLAPAAQDKHPKEEEEEEQKAHEKEIELQKGQSQILSHEVEYAEGSELERESRSVGKETSGREPEITLSSFVFRIFRFSINKHTDMSRLTR